MIAPFRSEGPRSETTSAQAWLVTKVNVLINAITCRCVPMASRVGVWLANEFLIHSKALLHHVMAEFKEPSDMVHKFR